MLRGGSQPARGRGFRWDGHGLPQGSWLRPPRTPRLRAWNLGAGEAPRRAGPFGLPIRLRYPSPFPGSSGRDKTAKRSARTLVNPGFIKKPCEYLWGMIGYIYELEFVFKPQLPRLLIRSPCKGSPQFCRGSAHTATPARPPCSYLSPTSSGGLRGAHPSLVSGAPVLQ